MTLILPGDAAGDGFEHRYQCVLRLANFRTNDLLQPVSGKPAALECATTDDVHTTTVSHTFEAPRVAR